MNHATPTRYTFWLEEALKQRRLAAPDGRALYAYRLSDTEFTSLTELLTNRGGAGSAILEKQRGFTACWLLYASEWWKRCYAGGAWSWAPIFAALAIEEPTQIAKQDWVNEAASYWHLSDESVGGKRHIGKVVVNGGLPLRLIREAGGALSRLLQSVLSEIARFNVAATDEQLLAEIEAQRSYLPKSYRQLTVYRLLVDVLSTVQTLKALCPPDDHRDPVEFLNQTQPDWPARFPLQLDNDAAQKLLGGLVRHAVRTDARIRVPFLIVRQVRFGDQPFPERFECALDVVSRIAAASLAEMINTPTEIIPAAMDLVARTNEREITIGQLLRRGDDYLIRIHTQLPKNWFSKSVLLELSRFGQTLAMLETPGSEAPDPTVPWVFEDASPVSKLLWAGSYKQKATSALVLMPAKAILLAEGNDEEDIATSEGMKLIRTTSSKLHISIGKESFQIECGAIQQQDQMNVLWSGERIYLPSQPSHVFRGFPKLYRVLDDGQKKFVPFSELTWRTDERDLILDRAKPTGMGTVLWRQGKQTLARLKVICLPPEACIDYDFGNSDRYSKATIFLRHWPIKAVSCDNTSIKFEATRINDHWQLVVHGSGEAPPNSLPLTITWSEGQRQSLTLPFPVEGAFVSHESGQKIVKEQQVSIQDLQNIHVQLRGRANRPWAMLLQIENSKSSNLPPRNIRCRPKVNHPVQEIRLYELQDAVGQLLASTDDLDAKVRISFTCSGSTLSSILVARYTESLERDWNKGRVNLTQGTRLLNQDVLANTALLALPLLDVARVPVALDHVTSEDVKVGAWMFLPECRQPGPWLIYPQSDSAADCRPIAWNVPEVFAGPTCHAHGLRAAMTLPQRDERIAAFTAEFEKLAIDPDNQDWKLVEIFVEKLSHLPLAGLDLWVGLARSPKAMVTALLMVEGFIDKIGERICKELPFEWVLTSPQDWLSAITALRENVVRAGDERELRLLRQELTWRLEWVRHRYPALHLSINLALARGLEIEVIDKEVKLLLSKPGVIANAWLPQLLVNENSDVQRFMQRAGQYADQDTPGPTQLRHESEQFAKSPPGARMLSQLRLPEQDWKYSLVVAPLMIAYEIAGGQGSAWIFNTKRLAALRQYRDFDAAWFDDAYKVAMVCAFNEGVISL